MMSLNMMPTSGTMMTSLKRIFWMNRTKTHVPATAAANAKRARPQRVEFGMKSRAKRMPSWADEIVAPVVGEMNLFMQSCCIISPAMLIPTPVHKIASKRGTQEARKIFHWRLSARKSPRKSTSIAPMKSEATPRATIAARRIHVAVFFFINILFFQ